MFNTPADPTIATAVKVPKCLLQAEDLNKILKVFEERQENILKLFKILLMFKGSVAQRNKTRLDNLCLRLKKVEETQSEIEDALVSKNQSIKLYEPKQISLMEAFVLQINQLYSKYSNRLILLGVSQEITDEVGRQIVPDQAMGWLSTQIIKLDILLAYIIKDSRQRFYNVEKCARQQIRELLASESKSIHKFFEKTDAHITELVDEAVYKKPMSAPFNLLKAIIQSNPNLSGSKKTKASNFEITGANKFSNTELAISSVNHSTVLTAKSKRSSQLTRQYSQELINSVCDLSGSLTSRNIPLNKTNTEDKWYRSSSCADLPDESEEVQEESISLRDRKNATTNVFTSKQNRPMSGTPRSRKNNKVAQSSGHNFFENSQHQVSRRETIRNSIEASRVNEGKSSNKSVKKEYRNPIYENVYQQLISANSRIKKSIDKYSISYSNYTKKKNCIGSLDDLDELMTKGDVEQSESDVHSLNICSLDDRQLDQQFSTPNKSKARSLMEIFDLGRPSSSKKKDLKTEPTQSSDRCIALPKLNIVDGLSLDDPKRVSMDKMRSSASFGRKFTTPKSNKRHGASQNMSLNHTIENKIEAHEKNAILRSFENIFKRQTSSEAKAICEINGPRTVGLFNIASKKVNEPHIEKLPIARTTVGRFNDIQDMANKNRMGPYTKKPNINIKKFCTLRGKLC